MDKKNLDANQENDQLVRKIKKAVWKYRLFGTRIPGEYIRDLLQLTGCSARFVKRYIRKEGIYGATYDEGIRNRQYFAETWVMQDLDFVISYTGAQKDSVTMTELIKRKDIEILRKIEAYALDSFPHKMRHYFWNVSVIKELVRLNDNDLLKYALEHIGDFDGINDAAKQALAEKKIEIFKTLLLHIRDRNFSYSNIMNSVIKSGDIKIYKAFSNVFKFSDTAILQGLKNDNEELKDFLLRFELSATAVCSLIRGENNTSILEKYVQRFPLRAEEQILLIRYDYASVLRLYQKQWGLDPSVMSYLSGLAVFEKTYGHEA